MHYSDVKRNEVLILLRPERTLTTCSVKAADTKDHMLHVSLHEMSGTGKPIWTAGQRLLGLVGGEVGMGQGAGREWWLVVAFGVMK